MASLWRPVYRIWPHKHDGSSNDVKLLRHFMPFVVGRRWDEFSVFFKNRPTHSKQRDIVLYPTRKPYCNDLKLISVARKRSYMTNFSPESMKPRPLKHNPYDEH